MANHGGRGSERLERLLTEVVRQEIRSGRVVFLSVPKLVFPHSLMCGVQDIPRGSQGMHAEEFFGLTATGSYYCAASRVPPRGAAGVVGAWLRKQASGLSHIYRQPVSLYVIRNAL